MLASDIDGTYIFHGGKNYPDGREKNNEKIAYFIENGGHFTFSSGRNHKDIYEIIPALDSLVNLPCVLCNGSFCYDTKTGEIKNPTYLEPAPTLDLLKKISEMGNIGWRISWRDGFLIRAEDGIIASDLQRMGLEDIATIKPFSEFDGKGYFKIVCMASGQTFGDVFAELRRQFPMFTYTRSSDKLVEIMPLGITKATQLGYIKGELAKTHPNVTLCCVGDFDNDADMLRFADIPMCPENATDAIKNICKVRLCHASQGALADAIEKIEQSL